MLYFKKINAGIDGQHWPPLHIEVWDKGEYFFGIPDKMLAPHDVKIGIILGFKNRLTFSPEGDPRDIESNFPEFSAQLMLTIGKYIQFLNRKMS